MATSATDNDIVPVLKDFSDNATFARLDLEQLCGDEWSLEACKALFASDFVDVAGGGRSAGSSWKKGGGKGRGKDKRQQKISWMPPSPEFRRTFRLDGNQPLERYLKGCRVYVEGGSAQKGGNGHGKDGGRGQRAPHHKASNQQSEAEFPDIARGIRLRFLGNPLKQDATSVTFTAVDIKKLSKPAIWKLDKETNSNSPSLRDLRESWRVIGERFMKNLLHAQEESEKERRRVWESATKSFDLFLNPEEWNGVLDRLEATGDEAAPAGATKEPLLDQLKQAVSSSAGKKKTYDGNARARKMAEFEAKQAECVKIIRDAKEQARAHVDALVDSTREMQEQVARVASQTHASFLAKMESAYEDSAKVLDQATDRAAALAKASGVDGKKKAQNSVRKGTGNGAANGTKSSFQAPDGRVQGNVLDHAKHAKLLEQVVEDGIRQFNDHVAALMKQVAEAEASMANDIENSEDTKDLDSKIESKAFHAASRVLDNTCRNARDKMVAWVTALRTKFASHTRDMLAIVFAAIRKLEEGVMYALRETYMDSQNSNVGELKANRSDYEHAFNQGESELVHAMLVKLVHAKMKARAEQTEAQAQTADSAPRDSRAKKATVEKRKKNSTNEPAQAKKDGKNTQQQHQQQQSKRDGKNAQQQPKDGRSDQQQPRKKNSDVQLSSKTTNNKNGDKQSRKTTAGGDPRPTIAHQEPKNGSNGRGQVPGQVPGQDWKNAKGGAPTDPTVSAWGRKPLIKGGDARKPEAQEVAVDHGGRWGGRKGVQASDTTKQVTKKKPDKQLSSPEKQSAKIAQESSSGKSPELVDRVKSLEKMLAQEMESSKRALDNKEKQLQTALANQERLQNLLTTQNTELNAMTTLLERAKDEINLQREQQTQLLEALKSQQQIVANTGAHLHMQNQVNSAAINQPMMSFAYSMHPETGGMSPIMIPANVTGMFAQPTTGLPHSRVPDIQSQQVYEPASLASSGKALSPRMEPRAVRRDQQGSPGKASKYSNVLPQQAMNRAAYESNNVGSKFEASPSLNLLGGANARPSGTSASALSNSIAGHPASPDLRRRNMESLKMNGDTLHLGGRSTLNQQAHGRHVRGSQSGNGFRNRADPAEHAGFQPGSKWSGPSIGEHRDG